MNDRIRWEDNGYGGFLGYVGTEAEQEKREHEATHLRDEQQGLS